MKGSRGNRLCPGSGMSSNNRKDGKCPYCKKSVAVKDSSVAAGGRDKGSVGGRAVIQLHYT
jgi:hypothetical protein